MEKMPWFERSFQFGLPAGMLPFYLERLEGTVARLRAKTNDISEEALSNMLNGKWSVKQNIGHLAEVDEISGKRIHEMIEGVPTMSPAVFEPRSDYSEQPIREILNLFSRNRKASIDRFRQLSKIELEKSAIHPRLKVKMTPIDLAWFDAEHDDHHLVRINEILYDLSKSKPSS
jgi:uncharacterized damage-inducible protein DinB